MAEAQESDDSESSGSYVSDGEIQCAFHVKHENVKSDSGKDATPFPGTSDILMHSDTAAKDQNSIEILRRELRCGNKETTIIYPSSIEEELRRDHGPVLDRISKYPETFVYLDYTLAQTFNLEKIRPNCLICDALIFSQSKAVKILTIVKEIESKEKLNMYNSQIARRVVSTIRSDTLINFNVVCGVIDENKCSDDKTFSDEVLQWERAAESEEIAQCLSMDPERCRKVIDRFLGMIVNQPVPDMNILVDSGRLTCVQRPAPTSPDELYEHIHSSVSFYEPKQLPDSEQTALNQSSMSPVEDWSMHRDYQMEKCGRDKDEIIESLQKQLSDMSLQMQMVQQLSINILGMAPPSSWQGMSSMEFVKVVNLEANDEEYTRLAKEFTEEYQGDVGSLSIEKIDRIQNRSLCIQYAAMKERMTAENPKIQVERNLWHGTDAEAVASINKNGFNRNFSGRNHTKFGHGTYFSHELKNCAHSMFATPNSKGLRHVYRASVLTGHYTKGYSDTRHPPEKCDGVFYHSVVDDVDNPSMFVVFSDTQAYPLYLVTFRSKEPEEEMPWNEESDEETTKNEDVSKIEKTEGLIHHEMGKIRLKVTSDVCPFIQQTDEAVASK